MGHSSRDTESRALRQIALDVQVPEEFDRDLGVRPGSRFYVLAYEQTLRGVDLRCILPGGFVHGVIRPELVPLYHNFVTQNASLHSRGLEPGSSAFSAAIVVDVATRKLWVVDSDWFWNAGKPHTDELDENTGPRVQELLLTCPGCDNDFNANAPGDVTCPWCGLEYWADADGDPDGDTVMHLLGVDCTECGHVWLARCPGHVRCPNCDATFSVDEEGRDICGDWSRDDEDDGAEASNGYEYADEDETEDDHAGQHEFEEGALFDAGIEEEGEPPKLAGCEEVPRAVLDLIESRMRGMATPALYEANAFRILEMPVTATDKELAKRQQLAERACRNGVGIPEGALRILPKNTAQAEDAIEKTVLWLADPVGRLLAELFWFWPLPDATGGLDAALQALSSGDVALTISIWLQRQHDPQAGLAALHNQAVFTHLNALEHERGLDPRNLTLAMQQWRQVIEHSQFETAIRQRVLQINDPRLPVSASRSVMQRIPVLLVLICARMAVQAAESDQPSRAKLLGSVLDSAGFPGESIRAAVGEAAGQVQDRIRALCETARQESERDCTRAESEARQLLDFSSRPLLALEALVGSEDLRHRSARETITAAVLDCYDRIPQDHTRWTEWMRILEKTDHIVPPSSTQRRCREALQTTRGFNYIQPITQRLEEINSLNLSLTKRVARVRQEVLPLVEQVRARLGESDRLATLASGMVAGALRSLAVDLANDEDDYEGAESALLLAKWYCPSGDLKSRLEDDLKTLTETRHHAKFQRALDSALTAPVASARFEKVRTELLPVLEEVGQQLGLRSKEYQTLSQVISAVLVKISGELNNQEKNYGLALSVIDLALQYCPEDAVRRNLQAGRVTVEQNYRAQRLRQEQQAKSGCFIATAAYGTEASAELDILRQFRDLVMLRSGFGQTAVRTYYRISPPVAAWLARKPWARRVVRTMLSPVIAWCRRRLTLEGTQIDR